MDRSSARLGLALAALALGLHGCSTLSSSPAQTPGMELYLDEGQMKAEALRHVPGGTRLADAKRVMEAKGFTCVYDRDWWGEMWAGADPARRGQVYLICSKYKPQRPWWHNFITSDEIRVDFASGDGKVADVRVTHVATCL
jgi:hypothetical protein